MLQIIPLLNEVNAMCDEMGKPQRMDLRLIVNQETAKKAIQRGEEEHFETLV